MNILIVRLSSIGDIVHTLPAVPLLKARFPESAITWAAEPAGAELLRGYPGIDRVVTFKKRELINAMRRAAFSRAAAIMQQCVRELRQERYDIVLDFQGLLKSGLMVAISKGKRKIGFSNAREGARLFYTEKAPAAPFSAHAIERNLALLAALDISPRPIAFSPLFDDNDAARLEQLLDRERVDRGKRLVCVHPCSRWHTKLWEPQKTASLCDRLSQELGCEVLLVGGQDEKASIAAIARLARCPVKNLASTTSLRTLACLLDSAALLITQDSGPLHLACAVETPVIALFGPTSPARTGPFGGMGAVVRKDLPCSPCFKRNKCPQEHHRCMNDITVAEVFEVCCNYMRA